jgi:hypothetical protein
VIYRQFVARPVSAPRRALLIPLALVAFGVVSLSRVPPFSLLDLAIIALDLAVGLVLGVVRGSATRVWRNDDGVAWQRGTLALALLWIVSVAARVGLGAAGGFLGVGQSASLAEIPLFFGATLAAQNVFLLVRVHGGWSGVLGGGTAS